MQVPTIERSIGIETYATDSLGIGGCIRKSPEDFEVEETLVDGSKATIKSASEPARPVLNSSLVKNDYLLCKLVKRNWDTFVLLKQIAKQLDIDAERIQIAGIKDAKALTAQHVTIEGAQKHDISQVKLKDAQLTSLGYLHMPLSPYYSFGNSFKITITSLNLSRATINKRISETTRQLRIAGGVPNFFGHQRFGTSRPVTHLVGKAIVNEDFERAAMEFLTLTFPNEHPCTQRARTNLKETGHFQSALEEFPPQLRYERLMLGHLIKLPTDFVGTFRSLPLRLRELFVQAYQSYMFNRVLSRRLSEGMSLQKAEIGDYVLKADRNGLPLRRTAAKAKRETLDQINAEIAKSRMLLCVPLFGSQQHFSDGHQGEIERRVFEEEQIRADGFRVKEMPEISSRGGLRPIQVPLVDLETNASEVSCSQGISLNVKFALHRGSYATVVLREFMKPKDPAKAGF